MSLHRGTKRSLLASMLACALVASPAPALAAPKKQQQRCIAAAESGQQLRSSGKLLEARKAFGPCTASACPATIRRDCGRWIDEIDSAIPSITVKLEDDTGSDVPEGRVLVDGEALLRAADGHATPIDPGVHRFVWTRDSGDVEQELVIREGERNRVIVLRAPSPAAAPTAATDPHVEPPSRGPVPWIASGTGVALLAAGGVFWGIGLHDRSSLSTSCAGAHACVQSDVDASRTKLIVGDVLVGVGILAVAGAVYLFLRPSSAPATSASR
ncbi:MAG: uncharacterized protein JWP87_1999 [Labilithrix sp.]|nr:uncharacterized protein [Labilithrix sp.]